MLKRLAELIVGTVRESDVTCRYGGEELLLILPHTNGDDAMALAEKLRQIIEKTEILPANKNRSYKPVQVTVSAGVASITPETESAHKLLGQADKALYFAKQRGRNRTMSCLDLKYAERC